MAKKTTKADSGEAAEQPALEDAMAELAEIVSLLESGKEPLDRSLANFERGMTLLRACHEHLDSAARRIEVLTGFSEVGDAETEEFDGRSTLERGRNSAGEDDDRADSQGLF